MDGKLGKKPTKQGRLPVGSVRRTAILPARPAALLKRPETFFSVGRNSETDITPGMLNRLLALPNLLAAGSAALVLLCAPLSAQADQVSTRDQRSAPVEA